MLTNQIIEITIIFLAIATFVALLTRHLKLPYTVGLVLIGLAIGVINRFQGFELPPSIEHLFDFTEAIVTPELILGILVTPLIFEAAFHLNWKALKKDLGFIIILAVPGVILTTFLVAILLYLVTDITNTEINFGITLVFGAMMAATDPVSVIALFKSLGVPKRLQVLMEGESLLNDGTAIVIFSLVLGAVLAGMSNTSSQEGFNWIKTIIEFVTVSGGGLFIGLTLGWVITLIISHVDDPLIETTLTMVLAFASFLIAEKLHMSGILAVVAAGLVSGNVGPRGMSPTTRIQVRNFWENAAFLANSIVFLLIGLKIDITELSLLWQPTILAIIAVLLSRLIVVYSFSFLGKNMPFKWNHVLFWGGLKGAISLALALSLPIALGVETQIKLQNMAFGVVLFSILIQGLTMELLVTKLHLTEKSEIHEEYERRHARAVAARAAYEHLQSMHKEGFFSDYTWSQLSPLLQDHAKTLANAVKDILEYDPKVAAEELYTARNESLRAEKIALLNLLSDGIITEETYTHLVRNIDEQLSQRETDWFHYIKAQFLPEKQITKVMTAVVQVQDSENAIQALNKAKIQVTRFSSAGGFLRRRNVTLLIGLSDGEEILANKILSESCKKRVEYLASPIEGSPFQMPASTPVTIGGATIFTLKVERYEEFQ